MEGLAKGLPQLSIQGEFPHPLQPHAMCSLNLCWSQRQWRAKLIDRRAVNMYYTDWLNEEAGQKLNRIKLGRRAKLVKQGGIRGDAS